MAAVVIILVILLIGAVAYFAYQANQKRLAALRQFAVGHDLTLTMSDNSLLGRWRCEPFTDNGFDHQIREVLTGHWEGRPVTALTYRYKTRSTNAKGESQTETHTFGVCVVSLPVALKDLRVGLENVLTRIGSAIGIDDIELESEDFNRRYRVKAQDPKFASDILNPRVMQLLLGNPACAFQITGSDIVAHHNGRPSLVDIQARWHMLCGVVAGVPEFVWKDAGLTPS